MADTTAPETSGQPAAPSSPPSRLGHFVIERPLGAGGMGMVLAARDVVLGREVALKIVRPGTGSKTNARLLREGQALARLSHPNVVTVYEVGEVDGELFIAMELVESAPGGTLRDWARESHPWREVAARFADAGRGLAAMHEIGLVHRDFKPSNVLVDRRGAVKVGDFGLVTQVGAEESDHAHDSPSFPRVGGESPSLTTPGTLVGTPAFMAPEQARGEPVDGRADQYSFCMSLRWALTGSYVADPSRPVPRRLRGLVERGLAFEPSRRYPSMSALLSQLERAMRPMTPRWTVLSVGPLAAAAVAVAVIVRGQPSAPVAVDADRSRLPTDPVARAEVERLAAEIARIDQAANAGHLDGVREKLAALIDRARRLGHGPTVISALHTLAYVQLASADPTAGEVTLREIARLAAAEHEDEQAAEAWLKLVLTVGYDLGKPEEAVGLLAAAEAAVVRAGSPLALRVRLLIYTAQLYDTQNRPNEGLAKLAEARRLVLTDPGAFQGAILGDIAIEEAEARSIAGDHAGALAAGRNAVAIYRKAYGPGHPDEAYPWHNMGEELRLLGRTEEAIAAFREAVAIREAKADGTANLAISLSSLGTALTEAGRPAEALAPLGRAVRIARETMSPDDPSRVAPLMALANADGLLGHLDDKIALEDEVLAALVRLKVKPENLAIVLASRGESEAARGHWAAALGYHDRSIAVFEEIEGPTYPMLIFPLEARGRALLALHRPAEALASLERALALEIPGQGRREQASAGFLRGRARVESGGDRAAGMAEARAGLAAMKALAPDHPDTRAAARWLARRR